MNPACALPASPTRLAAPDRHRARWPLGALIPDVWKDDPTPTRSSCAVELFDQGSAWVECSRGISEMHKAKSPVECEEDRAAPAEARCLKDMQEVPMIELLPAGRRADVDYGFQRSHQMLARSCRIGGALLASGTAVVLMPGLAEAAGPPVNFGSAGLRDWDDAQCGGTRGPERRYEVLDLVTANSGDSSVSVLLGNGNGTFGAKTDNNSGK